MTKKTRIIISLVLVLVAFAAGIAVFAQSDRDRSAQADGTVTKRYTVDDDGKIEPPPTSTTAAKGTAENPFFILEIVPYEGMGSIGYHIAGCEPIDMKKAEYANHAIPGLNQLYTTTSMPAEYRWVSEGKPSYYPDSPIVRTDVKQYGTMKVVSDGSGNYNQVLTYKYEVAEAGYAGTKYKDNGDGTYTPDGAGTYKRLVDTATYTPADATHPGNVLWTPLPAQTCKTMGWPETAAYENPTHEPDESGEFKMFFEGKEHYVVENIKKYTHKNIFLKESVGLAYEYDTNGKRIPYQEAPGRPTLDERIAAYKSVVYTVTPEDLNIKVDGELINKALIERADLISICCVDSSGAAVSTYESFKGYDTSGLLCKLNRKIVDGSGKTITTFNDNPLDWPAALEIYKRASSVTNPLPVIWDTHTYGYFSSTYEDVTLKCNTPNGNVNMAFTDKGSQDNLYKLYLLLYMMDTAVLESFFNSPTTFPTHSYTKTYNLGATDITRTYTTPLLTHYEGDGQRLWVNQSLYPWKSGLLPDVGSLDSQDNAAVLNTFGIMNNAAPTIFQYASGGAQNMVRNGIHIYDGSTYLTTGFTATCGVANDQYGREVYEFFDSIGVPKTSLTTAEVLYYLLNGLDNGPSARNNHQYKILELQPATSYKGGTTSGTVTNDTFWNAFVAMYGNTTKPATVERMSTSEFIGKQVECVSEYDLIYVGVNTLADNWSMDFTDTLGAEFIYAHNGPVIYNNRGGMQGWLGLPSPTPNPAAPTNAPGATPTPVLIDSAEANYPLSGNDLTKLAKQKLVEYVQSGAPVLFGTGFFTDETATDIVTTIDRNSNVYDFAENRVSSPIYEYALSKSSTRYATETAVRNGLAKSRRVEMEFTAKPLLYDGTKTNDSEKYLSSDTLSFTFKVKAPAGTQYLVALYVDINGDGVYSTDERMNGVSVRLAGGGGTGGIVEAGRTYVVTKHVSDRKGAVAWKLDLVNTDDYYGAGAPAVEKRTVHASLSGLSAIKASEKEPLRILQITMPADGDDRENVLMLPENGETGLDSIQQKFWTWTRDINGLELTFVRKSEEDLLTELASDADYIKDNFEMIILGFGDRYDGVKETIVLDAINAFTAAGKAVLYTHDASSMVGHDPNDIWGKELTLAFRDRYGMDRYDVSALAGSTTSVSAGLRADYPLVTTSDPDAINDLLTNSGYALAQGLTNGHVYRWTELENNLVTEKVTRINSGAITQYPYKIPDTISVARTHPQYYQLDLENENLTVWYCLTGSGAYDDSRDRSKIEKFYNATSNDVRNNYYIYNYGNITYSGMGHVGSMSDDEIKLFINTFVAAYRAAAKPVRIAVTNDDATKNVTTGDYFLCVDVDSSDSDALLGGAEMGAYDSYRQWETDEDTGVKYVDTVSAVSKRVEFYIHENTSVGGSPSYELTFYMENASGALTELKAFAAYRKADDKLMDDTVAYEADSDKIYYVDVPMKLETVDGKTAVTATQIKVKVKKTAFAGTPQELITDGDTVVNIIPRGLFDLD